MPANIHNIELAKDEFAAWKSNPTTKKVMQHLFNIAQTIKNNIGNGATLIQENSHQTQAKTALAIGKIAGINEVIYFNPFIESSDKEDG